MTADHIKLAKAIVAAVVASELVVGRINAKRCNANAEKVRILNEENAQLRAYLRGSFEQTDYLMTKLNEHEIPCTEFDKIVLNDLM